MEKKVLQLENANDRRRILHDTCVRAEEFTYSKQLNEEELIYEKDVLSQHDIKLDRLENEKKEVVADYNNRIKELREERDNTLSRVRSGSEEVTEQVYLLDDQESNRMGYYNSKGELVYERPLTPEEKQLRIVTMEKFNGTNN